MEQHNKNPVNFEIYTTKKRMKKKNQRQIKSFIKSLFPENIIIKPIEHEKTLKVIGFRFCIEEKRKNKILPLFVLYISYLIDKETKMEDDFNTYKIGEFILGLSL